MEIAIIGLGRMGMNMLERLANGGHTVFGFDLDPKKLEEVNGRGGVGGLGLAHE